MVMDRTYIVKDQHAFRDNVLVADGRFEKSGLVVNDDGGIEQGYTHQTRNKFQPSLWKAVIEDFFPDFLRFCCNRFDKEFNLGHFDFMDRELRTLYPEVFAKRRRGFADKLVKIYPKDGGAEPFLLHIEVLGYLDKNFAERMYRCYDKCSIKFPIPVTSLAIVLGENQVPLEYRHNGFWITLVYEYTVYRIADHDEAALWRDQNPFAWVILSSKLADRSPNLPDEEIMERFGVIIMKILSRKLDMRKTNTLIEFIRQLARFSDNLSYSIFETYVGKLTDNQITMRFEKRDG